MARLTSALLFDPGVMGAQPNVRAQGPPSAPMTRDSIPAMLRAQAWGGAQSVKDVVANVRAATWSRTFFTGVMALLSLGMMPLWLAASWFAFATIWEIGARPFLEDKLALPAAERSEEAGFGWLAAINFVGSVAYTAYPVAIWATGAPVGMVLATAWMCGSANHLFVYFAANRWLLLACGGPLAVMSLGAPFVTGGLTMEAAIGVSTLGALMLAACMFGLDRQVLLGNLAKHAMARASAEQANAAKSQFLATMSHELRSPLNSIIGYAELIEEEAEPAIAEDATKIRGSARQLLGVIDVILDISRLETGSIELRHERGPVSSVLQQLREAALPLATVNNNTITIAEEGALGDAEIDHVRLHQCLMQLVSNAAKFTQNGDIRIGARREALGTRDRLVFSVRDTGPGISPEDQARIFEPFVHGKQNAVRRGDGTGLGLTLARRLARLMGGDVRCESAPGQGATFTLWIDAGANP
ncbi:MAG: HAMP domain-containing sensor histidine kinase [Hyphomonadaceae bacterium]